MKIRRYAEGTTVPVEKSKMELEALLRRHGATGFICAWDETSGLTVFQFRIRERMIRFDIRTPKAEEFRGKPFKRIPALVEAETRRLWRARLLLVKAKLEMIASGDSTFEAEFLHDFVLPDGSTVGKWILPQIDRAYETGEQPRLLTGLQDVEVLPAAVRVKR